MISTLVDHGVYDIAHSHSMEGFPIQNEHNIDVTELTESNKSQIVALHTLPTELLGHILTYVDSTTLAMFHRMQTDKTCQIKAKMKQQHDDECMARIQWCLQNGPAYWPAHENKHRAPGNDKNFYYGIPPWHADGTVNPKGVPPSMGPSQLPGKNFALLDDYVNGFFCGKCDKWVNYPARAYVGKEEPEDWWWCQNCRDTKPALKLSNQDKKLVKAGAKCAKMESFFKPRGVE